MTDVRLTATNPEDSSVVPVACNAKGELLLEEPIAPPEFDGNLDGDLTVSGTGTFASDVKIGGTSSSPKILLKADDSEIRVGENPGTAGSNTNGVRANGGIAILGITKDYGNTADFISCAKYDTTASNRFKFLVFNDGTTYINAGGNGVGSAAKIKLKANGNADFQGDVVVGSRDKNWMLVESGGLCHMVEQNRVSTTDLVDPASEYPKLRDVFAELNVIEKALEEVMEKLRMTEPDGWPVWDGSDNSR